jgi:exodeoxyribonuclease V alpha subunit
MDLVEPVLTQEASEFVLRDRIVVLDRSRRFRPDSAIAELAETIRRGDVHAAVNLLERSAGPPSDHLIGDTASDTELAWIPIPDSWEPGLGPVGLCADPVVSALIESMIAARVGPAAAGDIHASMVGEAADKLLCVTRVGPLGSTRWNELFDSIARQRLGPWTAPGSWFPGRPLMVTRNDPLNQLFNGDSGVVVARPGQPDAVGFPHGHEARIVEFARIESAEPNWAMTVHKSQGSEFDHVIVVVPPPPMRTLTRELLYTAITRARHRVTILGSSEGFAEGVRRRISRASGLTDRLVGPSSRITGGSAADSNREAGG